MEQFEQSFTCPYCGATISILLDPSVSTQKYVEDCEVCCNPMEVAYTFEEDELASFDARSIEQ